MGLLGVWVAYESGAGQGCRDKRSCFLMLHFGAFLCKPTRQVCGGEPLPFLWQVRLWALWTGRMRLLF